mmetsp:Transcript_6740/g.9097  ORF Transcript_6740/g.9097 Transcript_6740/m.9097 type:complete len:203 (+) Transcript_6740:57-665(+)|eukprot:CAMPEP_0117758066 /NCGR_PEP_ID=MMETSP0947-20121206/15145_1 /TAXON_ID=44440 /ORGANISM="Chattonella subsalsa, Strain CCMP2191" /LENGTH=202 /DNA_ID=CAMNT_0005578159 /DNA_START=42 /DNA_END=650 /DNA_ORIENTATION=+
MADHHQESLDEVREQDRFLPIANISRIMKRSLPENAKIAKDAKETVQECVSEFISFITSEASDKCQQEKRKTINGDDLLWAMSTLGFDKYVDPLKLYLAKYRESVKGEKPDRRGPSRREAMEVPGGMHGLPPHPMHGGLSSMGQQSMGFPSHLMPTGAPVSSNPSLPIPSRPGDSQSMPLVADDKRFSRYGDINQSSSDTIV